jgi:hypothetical protein
MVLFKAPTMLMLLLLQTVAAPPATPTSPGCAGSRAPNGFDCCLHLALRSSANPFILTQPPSAQPQIDDERTIEDDPKR